MSSAFLAPIALSHMTQNQQINNNIRKHFVPTIMFFARAAVPV